MNYSETIHILNVDPIIRSSLTSALDKADYHLRLHDDAGRFFEAVETDSRGCVIIYVDMPEMIGIELLRDAKARRIELPIIVITAQANVRGAIQVMKEGAFDLLELPVNEAKLLASVQQALTRRVDSPGLSRTRADHARPARRRSPTVRTTCSPASSRASSTRSSPMSSASARARSRRTAPTS